MKNSKFAKKIVGLARVINIVDLYYVNLLNICYRKGISVGVDLFTDMDDMDYFDDEPDIEEGNDEDDFDDLFQSYFRQKKDDIEEK